MACRCRLGIEGEGGGREGEGDLLYQRASLEAGKPVHARCWDALAESALASTRPSRLA